jgi:hypothetical protein
VRVSAAAIRTCIFPKSFKFEKEPGLSREDRRLTFSQIFSGRKKAAKRRFVLIFR